MTARQDAVDSHALDQVAEERERVWDVAEQLAAQLEVAAATVHRFALGHPDMGHEGTFYDCPAAVCAVRRVALAEWKKVTG